jgi:hypothetical protein
MKRSNTTTKQVAVVQKASLERPDSGMAVIERTEEQLIDELAMTVCEATGTHNGDVANRIICQAASAQVWPKPAGEADRLINATAVIREMAPQNATEAMLAVQMLATNDAALMFLHRATSEGQPTEVVDANVLRATRLMRLFHQQTEAMQKLKGKAGQQNLIVEQVNVHQGGQAIVGSVSTTNVEGK